MNGCWHVRVLLVIGAVVVVLASTPYDMFDLSRFLAPKELALNSVAPEPSLPDLCFVNFSARVRGRLVSVVALLGCLAVLRSCGQVAAMALADKAHTVSQVAAAARLDPGNLNLRLRLAANGYEEKHEPAGLSGWLRKLRFRP